MAYDRSELSLSHRHNGRAPSPTRSAQSWSPVAFCSVATVPPLPCALTGPDRDDLEEFYTGYRTLSPLRNGLAVAGDYISAATVLTIGGVIALCGYDGVVLA